MAYLDKLLSADEKILVQQRMHWAVFISTVIGLAVQGAIFYVIYRGFHALAAPAEGKTIADVISEEAAILGEKVELRRIRLVTGEHFSIYLHKTSKDLPPQVGVVLGYTGDDAETARSVAQHISFAAPEYLTREDVPAEAVEKERAIVEQITREEGKPEAALPKIVEGRLGAYFKQVALLEQDYAKDNKLSVGKVLSDAGLTVTDFARFKVGA